MMNIWRTYIQPFDEFGVYTGQWVEVTKDTIMTSLGSISSQLDNTTYDIGILRSSGLTVQMDNKSGRYSDTGQVNSMFKFKRGGAKFKLTWEIDPDGPALGISQVGSAYLSTETTIFTGIIIDDSTTLQIKNQGITFTILGRESILKQLATPALSNGMLISVAIYAILNQSILTNLVTVSLANIVCSLDQTIDDVTPFVNKSGFSSIADLLAASNSVLYIANDTIYVSSRTAASSSSFTFYGQSSNQGNENIIDLTNIRTGLNRVTNSFAWSDTALVSQNSTSIDKYNNRISQIKFDFITDNTKRQNILDALMTEFSNPKLEFEISCPMTYDTLAIGLLSRVYVDYPISFTSSSAVPYCGYAICGNAALPRGMWAFYLDVASYFKIIAFKLDIQKSVLTFNLRLI